MRVRYLEIIGTVSIQLQARKRVLAVHAPRLYEGSAMDEARSTQQYVCQGKSDCAERTRPKRRRPTMIGR